MKRTPIFPDLTQYPQRFRTLLEGAALYDSSCSPTARVTYIDRDGGLFLKSAPKGSLSREASLARFYHSKGLGAEVLDYCTSDRDWLLTRKLPGEDCLDTQYLSDPKRLCDTTAQLLRQLHETPWEGCPVMHTEHYLETSRKNYREQRYDASLFPDNWGYTTPEEAWQVIAELGPYLKTDTLLHGDYCLPNILLDNWQFSGFIDLDSGGVGDRHLDLFWGCWSLFFNLKTDAYRDRFLDAYGRDRLEPDMLRLIAACEVFR